MADKHSQSFFGQSTGLTLVSSSKADPHIFLKCIKKKPDGSWEKPSLGEGKTIKCSLDEIVMILEVFNRKQDSWSSYHNFNDVKTQISFKWEDAGKKKLLVYIGKYSKMLNFAQTEIFRMLLEHLIKEKIKFATMPTLSQKKGFQENYKELSEKTKVSRSKELPSVKETIEKNDTEVSNINGLIEGAGCCGFASRFRLCWHSLLLEDRAYWFDLRYISRHQSMDHANPGVHSAIPFYW